MATKNKTTVTTQSVDDFIESFVDSNQKKQDSYQLIKLMQQWSGFEAQMWGPSIIGFGSYHYKYASGHEGDAPMIAFSPRKAAISLYVFVANEENKHLLLWGAGQHGGSRPRTAAMPWLERVMHWLRNLIPG